MDPFTYSRAGSLDEALTLAGNPGAAILAGGTTMVDLMRAGIAAPERLVDIRHVPGLSDIETGGDTIRLGALARMADVAENDVLARDYPALVEGLRLAASQQLRNAATLGGNILQRTRCTYFRDGVSDCNKRVPGSGCSAINGEDRDMALFGTSEKCVATYAGDWGVTLAAFDTTVTLASLNGERSVPFEEFHLEYGDDPARETVMAPGEIVTAITIKATGAGRRSTYVKVRDRQSYAYALVSAAVALEMDGDTVVSARIALGGVASKPWRARDAETSLAGAALTLERALEAGRVAFADARPLRHNAFKIELGRRAVARALMTASKRS